MKMLFINILFCLFALFSIQIVFSQEINEGKYNPTVLLGNDYDTIYSPLINEVGIMGVKQINSNFFVYKKNDRYGYIVLYVRKKEGKGYQQYLSEADSFEICPPIYDSIYWMGSIYKHSNWSKEKSEKYRSVLYLQKDNKIGLLFLHWACNLNHIYQMDEFVGVKSSSHFEPKYQEIIFGKPLILKNDNQYGFLFSNELVLEPQYDSIKQIQPYPPFDQYYYVWEEGRCGVIFNNRLILPAIYIAQNFDFNFDPNEIIAIKEDNKPYTIFFIKDSTYLQIKTDYGFVLTNDSIFTTIDINNFLDGSSIIEVTRTYNIGPKSTHFYPKDISNNCDEIYLIDKEKDSTISAYNNPNSKYILLSGIVVEIQSKNRKKTKYEITLYKKHEQTEIVKYTWLFNENPLIEIKEQHTMPDGTNYFSFGYFNSKEKFKTVGYINLNDGIFQKKL